MNLTLFNTAVLRILCHFTVYFTVLARLLDPLEIKFGGKF